MKLHFEHRGRCVLVIDFEDLTEDEQAVIMKIGRRQLIRARSAECNADFVAYWAVGSVRGLCNGMREMKRIDHPSLSNRDKLSLRLTK
jgi:hypothetical protein